jgi:hypothetical protein
MILVTFTVWEKWGDMCVCVCVRERERERVKSGNNIYGGDMCVCVCEW